jgi:plasmid stabilization system protein ParE
VRRHGLAPAAENDLALIFDYIAQRNPDAADRLMDAMIEAFDRLADHPKLGHRRTDLTDLRVRFWRVREYLIVHRGEDRIEILRVLDGRRDVAAELSRKSPAPRSGGR